MMIAHMAFAPMWSDQAKELGHVLNTSADSCISPSTLGSK